MHQLHKIRLALAKVVSEARAKAAERDNEFTQPVYLALYTSYASGACKEITGTEAMPRQRMERGFSKLYPYGAHAPKGVHFPKWAGKYPIVITHARLWREPIGGSPARMQIGDGQLEPTPLIPLDRAVVLQPGDAFALASGSGITLVVH